LVRVNSADGTGPRNLFPFKFIVTKDCRVDRYDGVVPCKLFRETSNICKPVRDGVTGSEPVSLLLLNDRVLILVNEFKLEGKVPVNALLLIIKVTIFVNNPIEDGTVEPNRLFPASKVPSDEYWPTDEGILNCKLLLDKSNVTSFVRDVVNVKKPPVSLLLFNTSEFREDKDASVGRLPPTPPPTTATAVRVDS